MPILYDFPKNGKSKSQNQIESQKDEYMYKLNTNSPTIHNNQGEFGSAF